MTMIVDRIPLATMTPHEMTRQEFDDFKLERFANLLALHVLKSIQNDLRSRDPARRADGLLSLYNHRAEQLAAGVGLDIDWVRAEMDSDHFFVELPDPRHGGQRFRSAMQPVVIRGVIRPCADSDVYRILVQEPVIFLERHEVVTSADWIEVAGPARWLSDNEYIALLEASGVDKSYVAAARLAAGARR